MKKIRRCFFTALLCLGFAAARVVAVPVDAPTADGVPPGLVGAAVAFHFTEKGSYPTVPAPVRLLFQPNGAAMLLTEMGLPISGKFVRYKYAVTSPTAAQLQTGPINVMAPQDVDQLTFSAPDRGTFLNVASRAAGTFVLIRNAMSNPMELQQKLKAIANPPSGAVAVAPAPPTTPVDAQPPRPRASGVRDYIFSEIPFNNLFSKKVETLTPAVLAFLYESRVAQPDYFALGTLILDNFKLAGKDEFRKHENLKRNLPALEAKLDKASGRRVVVFGRRFRKVDYDFTVGGYRCFEPTAEVQGFGAVYGYIVNNQPEVQFFKVPEDKAAPDKFLVGKDSTYEFQIYAVVEGLGPPSAIYSKVISLKVVGISLFIGNNFKGLYRFDTQTWQEDRNPEKDFAGVK